MVLKFFTSSPKTQWRARALLITLKIGRTAVIGFTIYQIGVTHGMIYYASDPHAIDEQFVIKMVQDFGGTKLAGRRSNEYILTERVAKRVLEGARRHAKLKIEELELLQYRLKIASRKTQLQQSNLDTTQRPGGQVDSSVTLAASVHDMFGSDESTGAKRNAVEKGPIQFMKEVIITYFKPTESGGNTTSSLVQTTALHPTDTGTFVVPSKFDLPPNSRLHRIKSYLKDTIETENLTLSETEIERYSSQISREMAFWKTCLRKCRGDWKVVLFNSEVPNAFVTPLVPKKIFVTEAMLKKLSLTEDELGLILSHEVSHLLLDHTHSSSSMENFLNIAYLVIITAVGADFFLLGEMLKSMIMPSVVAANSREHESEADWLGMMIAARGCFDIHKATYAMKKLSDIEMANGRVESGWTDTHPLSIDRYNQLTGLAKEIINSKAEYNPQFDHSKCSTTHRNLLNFFYKQSG